MEPPICDLLTELIEAADHNNGDAKETVEVLKDDSRRKAALEQLYEGEAQNAKDDCKRLFGFLHKSLYKHTFAEWKKSIDKARAYNKKSLLNTIDTSDEAICLLVLEVKAKELIGLIEAARKAGKKEQDAQAKIDNWRASEAGRNAATVPQNLEEALKKAKEQVKSLKKKGRKKSKKRKAGEVEDAGLDNGNEDCQQVEGKELAKFEKRYEALCGKIERARKEDEEGRGGWYEKAWGIVEAHEQLGVPHRPSDTSTAGSSLTGGTSNLSPDNHQFGDFLIDVDCPIGNNGVHAV